MSRLYFLGRDAVPSHLRLEAGQTEHLVFVALPGVSAEVDLTVELDGEGAQVQLDGLFVCSAEERLTLKIDLRHNASNTISRQLFNGIAGGSARTEFNGKVLVREGLHGIKAAQENHNILLDDSALVVTSPQLEIYSDDVECSHGATTGFLNLDEQFYMRSRGIPESEAKVLQMISFLAPVVGAVEDEAVRDALAQEVEKAVRLAAGQ